MDENAEIVHATCVAIGSEGVLIRGPSGAGKSDLALRLLHLSPVTGLGDVQLVCDDQVSLKTNGAYVVARAAPNLAGKLEVRGIGIVHVTPAECATVRLVVDAVSHDAVVRMPDQDDRMVSLRSTMVPRVALDVLEASAPAKVLMALRLALAHSLHANRSTL